MSRKVLFTEDDFIPVKHRLITEFHMTPVKKRETEMALYAQNSENPKKYQEPGYEEGFTYFALGLRVYLWTSYLSSKGRARILDSVYVIIVQNDKIAYSSHRLHRTKNLFKRIFTWVRLCIEHVDARPYCKDPTCRRPMLIVKGQHMNQRYWKCTNPAHTKAPTVHWDIGLSPESLKFVNQKRRWVKNYNKKRQSQGKSTYGMARILRKSQRRKLQAHKT